MKLVRGNKSDILDKIETAFRRVVDAYCKFGKLGYLDEWEIIEGKVHLIIGDYNNEEYDVEPFDDIEMPFRPSFNGTPYVVRHGGHRKEMPDFRTGMAALLEPHLDAPKYDDGNNIAFYIMMNALRLIPNLEEDKSSEDEE